MPFDPRCLPFSPTRRLRGRRPSCTYLRKVAWASLTPRGSKNSTICAALTPCGNCCSSASNSSDSRCAMPTSGKPGPSSRCFQWHRVNAFAGVAYLEYRVNLPRALLAEVDVEAVLDVVLHIHFRGPPVLHARRTDPDRVVAGPQLDQQRGHAPQHAVGVDLRLDRPRGDAPIAVRRGGAAP